MLPTPFSIHIFLMMNAPCSAHMEEPGNPCVQVPEDTVIGLKFPYPEVTTDEHGPSLQYKQADGS